ncbi:MAG: aspartate-semialdehyde dehydrogenase [Desulfonatronovibrionaceae bacterium]
MQKRPVVAVAGATGAVGREMLKILEERDFPAEEVIPLASSRSAGSKVDFKGKELNVQEMTPSSFKGVDLALFSAGGAASKEFAPLAVDSGCVVVDNSNAWRMDANTPLVVPEVNPEDLKGHRGIIANPNCSTIQMVVALKPLYDVSRIKRIVVSTYQAVSGSGNKAIEELGNQVRRLFNGLEPEAEVYPHQIAFNCLPHIDSFQKNGYTGEEMKMVNETRKIFHDVHIGISATTVRVPVFYGHSESVNIETESRITAKEARAILSQAPGVTVLDNPEENAYPMAVHAAGEDATFVGRIREDDSVPCGLNLWVVSDNIRKGAALNTIQIAETLLENNLVRVPA